MLARRDRCIRRCRWLSASRKAQGDIGRITIDQTEQSRILSYDADGNLLAFGPWSYTYDSAQRLGIVSSNAVLCNTLLRRVNLGGRL